MSMFNNPFPQAQRAQPLEYGVESRVVAHFFNAVYAWMFAGLGVTASVGWWLSTQHDLMVRLYTSGIYIMLVIVQFILVFTIARAVQKIGPNVATAMFLVYAGIMGVLLSAIFIIYPIATIGAAFAVSGGMFAVMAIFGFSTGKDLSKLGEVMYMALIGLVLATIVNMFVASTALDWLLTYAGVAIFCGLTAYDNQRLKSIAYQTEGNQVLASRMAIVGSLMLYLDFINLFMYILRILGDRRR